MNNANFSFHLNCLNGAIGQWFGNYYAKVAIDILTPFVTATLSATYVVFGDRKSRGFAIGVCVASIPAIALTTTQFGMLISSGTPWIDPNMWDSHAHSHFIGALIWGPLSIILGFTSLLATWSTGMARKVG
ncbi:MAG: hypothetical protein JNK90_08275 [Planctomycetaceae bacterium]|nr:hypothetical protein [Planctomycetaceae bacterium]